MRTITVLILVAASAAGLLGAAPLTLTLDQAIDYAREHSRDLAAAQLDIAKAEALVDEVLANYYPSIGIQGTFAYLSQVSVLTFPGSNITIPLGSHANYSARLSLSQPLFAGGRMLNAYRAARIGHELATDSITRKLQSLDYNVRRSFNTILLTKELRNLVAQSLDRARDHFKVVVTLRDAGYVSKYDSLRTVVQVENLVPQIARLDNGIKLAVEAFKLTIGMPLDREVDVSGTLDAASPALPESLAIAEALANRVELKQLDKARQALQLVRSITRASYYPMLGASASYDLKNPAGLTGGGWAPSLTLALGLNYTLFDGMKTRAQLRQSDADIRRLELSRGFARDGIILQVKEALTGMQTGRTALAAARNTVVSAEEGLGLARARYTEGHGSNLDVLDAQLALFQAQVNVLTAAKDCIDAHDRLVYAIGKEE